jgi:serine/threonine-protein kinase RsbW
MLCDRTGGRQPEAEVSAQAPPGGFHAVFAADQTAVRGALRAALARFVRQMTDDEAGTMELVLAEVFNNIVEHAFADGGPGQIELTISRDELGLMCRIADDGAPMPEGRLPAGRLPSNAVAVEDLPEGGFGWFLIRDLTRELSYVRDGSRNLLMFRLPIAA